VVNQVNTDGIMPAYGSGDLQLGTNTVGTGNQYRLAVVPEFKKPAEEADSA
jgi:hypothetical protein